MKKAAILYHYPCPEGAFAALAAQLYFSSSSTPTLFFPNTVYSPLTTQSLPLNDIDRLYLLDFVGPPGFVHDVSEKVPWVVVLDHHKTDLESLRGEGSKLGGNVSKVKDMERSGATIAYDDFKAKVGDDDRVREFERVRRLFEYIEDGDLWRWQLDRSKAFLSGLKDLNLEFDLQLNPSLFDQLLSLDVEAIISQVMSSLSHKQKLIDDALNQSYTIALGGGAFWHCLAVDADAISELRSELGKQVG